MAKKKIPLIPLGVHVLVEPVENPNDKWFPAGKTRSKSERGIVLQIGEAVESKALQDAIGKTVVFRQYAEEEYMIANSKFYLIEESDIMGIWNE